MECLSAITGIPNRQKHGVWAGFLNQPGEKIHRTLLSRNGSSRVKGNIGDGALVYEGVQGVDFPEMSVWIFQMFGGICTSGDPYEPEAMKWTPDIGPNVKV